MPEPEPYPLSELVYGLDSDGWQHADGYHALLSMASSGLQGVVLGAEHSGVTATVPLVQAPSFASDNVLVRVTSITRSTVIGHGKAARAA